MDKSSSLRNAIAAPLDDDLEPLFLLPEGMPGELAARAVAETALQLELLLNSCVQIIVPTALDLRNCRKLLHYLNLIYNTPLEATTETPFVSVYSAESWIRKVLPQLDRSNKTFVFCIIEGSGYNHDVDLIFQILVGSKRHQRNSRCLWFAGPVLRRYADSVTGQYIQLPFCNPITTEYLQCFSSAMKENSKSLFKAIADHLEMLRREDKVIECLLVLPSIELFAHFRRFFSATCEAKYWTFPSTKSLSRVLFGKRHGTKILNFTLPENVYGNMFFNSNALIDSCLRKSTAESAESREYRRATASEITDIANRLSRGNSYFVHCLCIEQTTWSNLKPYDETQRNKKQMGLSILELEDLNVASKEYLCGDDRFQKTLSTLLKHQLLTLGENQGEYGITEIGKFALHTRLSSGAALLLDTVLFYQEKQTLSDPTYCIYAHYIATITSVWLDFRNHLFHADSGQLAIVKKSEFEFGDSLGGAVLMYLNYVHDSAKSDFQGVSRWCHSRGVRATQLMLFNNAVSKLVHTLSGLYGRIIKMIPLEQIFSFVDDGPLEAELKDVRKLMFRIFSNKIWQSTGTGSYFRQDKQGNPEYWLLDHSIEPWIKEHLESKSVRFLAFSKNKQTKTLSRLVFE